MSKHGTHARYNTCRIRMTTFDGVTYGRPCQACTQAAKEWAEAWFQKNHSVTIHDVCNGCDAIGLDPHSAAGYCYACEANAQRRTA